MSIDVLQNQIRKKKNPSALVLAPTPELIPEGFASGGEYCCKLLEALRELIPAVRVNFASFALVGEDGISQMEQVLKTARNLGYYVILDWMHLEDPAMSTWAAKTILSDERYPCDAVTLCGYAGSDCIKPFLAAAGKKAVFVSVRTANKSGAELQDLQTGGRVVYTAAADLLTRLGETSIERCGYSRLAAVAGASNAASIRTLRQKFPRLFLLIEGLDSTGGNAKNASYAFDRLGHGAVCSAGASILGAWKEAEAGTDPIVAAMDAAERMKRNLTRYVTVL